MGSDDRLVTDLLLAWRQGDDGALSRLTPLVYDHLHRLAHHYIAGERPGHTLQATALVNEAYLRLVDCNRIEWHNRAQFFAVAAQLMRRILVDFARARGNQKRGGELHRTCLDEALVVSDRPDPNLVALDEALNALSAIDPRKAQVVELRFFGGLEEREIAEVLKVSVDTVQRDWKTARVWLYNHLRC
jgi:RNA polymerase sigma factor (TIGR02999 family)